MRAEWWIYIYVYSVFNCLYYCICLPSVDHAKSACSRSEQFFRVTEDMHQEHESRLPEGLVSKAFKGGSVAGRNTFSGKKCPVKRYTFGGKRDHKFANSPVPGGRWRVRTGRRGGEEVERVCSDRHETCSLYL